MEDNRIPIRLDLEQSDSDDSGEIGRIVAAHLHARGRSLPAVLDGAIPLWPAEYFGLHRVKLFCQASADQQRAILDRCAASLLNEAYFIEKSGGAYCAKMILMAETASVRQVYSLIAADEASHLQWIRPYVPEADRAAPDGPMMQFLSGLIERCDPNTLAYLVQVILEGWGLDHYRSLSRGCSQPELATVFHSIHKDEALHHHTGEVVFDVRQIAHGQHDFIVDSLHAYCEMARTGPQAVVSALQQTLGGLNQHERARVFAELDSEIESHRKLDLLRTLMAGPGREPFLARLEEKEAFTPYAPQACAAILG